MFYEHPPFLLSSDSSSSPFAWPEIRDERTLRAPRCGLLAKKAGANFRKSDRGWFVNPVYE
jgi:hypothetical protein